MFLNKVFVKVVDDVLYSTERDCTTKKLSIFNIIYIFKLYIKQFIFKFFLHIQE